MIIFDIPSGSGNNKLKKALRDWSSTHERRVFTFMEIWKDVKGYEGIYEVSNLGNVKSKDRLIVTSKNIVAKINQRILKKKVTKKGYERLTLSVSGKHKDVGVHRLVAQAFIQNPENKKEVNHIDGNKQNNQISNLEWCTRNENEKHAFKIGLKSLKGEKHTLARFTESEVLQIREMRGIKTGKQVAKEYGVTDGAIYRIWNRKTWNHI